MICNKCKKEFPDEFPFCTYCGEKVTKKSTAAPLFNTAPKQRRSAETSVPKQQPVVNPSAPKIQVQPAATVGDGHKISTDDRSVKRKIKALSVLVVALVAIIVILVIYFIGSCQHVFSAATCSSPQTCEKCGETVGEALVHSVSAWENVKQSTCTENGEERGICTLCNQIVTQQTETAAHVAGNWETKLPINENGKGRRELRCAVCGEVIEVQEYETEAVDVTGVTSEEITNESVSVQESEQQSSSEQTSEEQSTTLADETTDSTQPITDSSTASSEALTSSDIQ